MKFKKNIGLFFTSIDYRALFKSSKEVLFLTMIALLPLMINIVIAAVKANEIWDPLKSKIIPGEILSYCLSFLAPSLYLLTKIQDSGYRLPLVHFFSITTLLIYVLCIVLYLITKNNWIPEINMNSHKVDLYFKLSLVFFSVSIIYRVYSVYHGKRASNWSVERTRSQNDFNNNFLETLNS